MGAGGGENIHTYVHVALVARKYLSLPLSGPSCVNVFVIFCVNDGLRLCIDALRLAGSLPPEDSLCLPDPNIGIFDRSDYSKA